MVEVCLMVEGSYPYITGGVSSWVHQLIVNLPNTTFGIVHLTSSIDPTREIKYEMPSNVKWMKELALHDYHYLKKPKYKKSKKNWGEDILKFHNNLINEKFGTLDKIIEIFRGDDNGRAVSFEELIYSEEAWNTVETLYSEFAYDHSYVDYFWTWRFTHMPLFKIMQFEYPDAEVYHTVSTGYAGLAAVVAKIKNRRPMMVTEHGIYTRERKIEIQDADWIYQAETQIEVQDVKEFFKNFWIKIFRYTGKVTYEYADNIITLCKFNKMAQLSEGAPEEKIQIIPNGVFPERYMKAKKRFKKRKFNGKYTIGFAGRVVSIKDVKTLIRSIKGVHDVMENVELLVMGPTDEEEEYFNECVELVELLGLEEVIQFLGLVRLDQYYDKIDVLVLTSVSEAQPLVILEAHCVGVPAVSTDVGACRELLYGNTQEDQDLGKSGFIVDVASPDQTAEAILKLLQDDEMRKQFGLNGQRRTYKYYSQQDLLAQYNTLYENLKFYNEET